MSELPVLSIVVPCLNEEECIENTAVRLINILNGLFYEDVISDKSFIFFVDDGSSDNTWNMLANLKKTYPDKIKAIKFSKNFGNQKALLAGLSESTKYNVDCVITIDADLQQDENKIKEFVLKFKDGAQIVCGIRNDRKTDTFLKKISALLYYRFMNLLGVNIKINHSDFRLIGSQVLETLQNYKESNLFLRGMFNEIGFNKQYVNFDVKPRSAGKTKYTFFSLFSLALNGIVSYSLVPLRFVTFIGFIMAFTSFLIGLSSVYDYYFRDGVVSGWATIVVSVCFIGGIQILCLGIIAEYLGQLFVEVKARPRYIIEKSLD